MRIIKRLLCIGLMLTLAGCSSAKDAPENEKPKENKVEVNVYNNLVTEEEQNEIASILQQDKLSNVEVFSSWVRDFNDTMKEDVGLVKQWTPLNELNYNSTYKTDEMAIAWDETHEQQGDANSRMAAFLLFDGWIQGSDHEEYGSYILMDMEQIETDKMFEAMKPHQYKYSAVFDEVDLSMAKNQQEFDQAYPDAWAKRGVTFKEGNASLINVVLQAPLDNVAFIAHSGILVQQDGYVLFVEKLDYCNAYQVSRFKDEKDLVKELKRRTYLVGDESFDMAILQNENVIGRK